ncbi:denn domain-containing [Anaeramoeba flamelloides]|uniref:Denn domain-containing n=1 Tax=Anaeramoeba flamelloides TaxID=1746091 RepID=A0AAV7YL23_9EUKA|nr:denn domain-containing [Anaeramoeba flamelloides]
MSIFDSQDKIYEFFYLLQYNKEKLDLKSKTNRFPEIEVFKAYPVVEKDNFIEKIKMFCFVDVKSLLEQNQTKIENFYFVITLEDGVRYYVHCHASFINKDTKPECIVFISKSPLFTLFEKITPILYKRRQKDIRGIDNFVEVLYKQIVPKKGRMLKFEVPKIYDLPRLYFEFPRSHALLGDYHIEQFFSIFNAKQIVCIFAAILFERRIVFTGNSLKSITNAISTCMGLILPFKWEQILIPVLPEHIIDTTCAPMPFILGIHSTFLPLLKRLPIEEIVYIDLNEGKLIDFDPIDLALFPHDTITKLIENLDELLIDWKENGTFRSNLVIENFLDFFVEIFYDWENYMNLNEKTWSFDFNFNSFKKQKNKKLRAFIEAFKETQLFEIFLREKEMEMKGSKTTKGHEDFNNKANRYNQMVSQNKGFFKGLRRKLDKNETINEKPKFNQQYNYPQKQFTILHSSDQLRSSSKTSPLLLNNNTKNSKNKKLSSKEIKMNEQASEQKFFDVLQDIMSENSIETSDFQNLSKNTKQDRKLKLQQKRKYSHLTTIRGNDKNSMNVIRKQTRKNLVRKFNEYTSNLNQSDQNINKKQSSFSNNSQNNSRFNSNNNVNIRNSRNSNNFSKQKLYNKARNRPLPQIVQPKNPRKNKKIPPIPKKEIKIHEPKNNFQNQNYQNNNNFSKNSSTNKTPPKIPSRKNRKSLTNSNNQQPIISKLNSQNNNFTNNSSSNNNYYNNNNNNINNNNNNNNIDNNNNNNNRSFNPNNYSNNQYLNNNQNENYNDNSSNNYNNNNTKINSPKRTPPKIPKRTIHNYSNQRSFNNNNNNYN